MTDPARSGGFQSPRIVRCLGILGLELVSRQRGLYRCDAPGHASEIALTTLVFRRR